MVLVPLVLMDRLESKARLGLRAPLACKVLLALVPPVTREHQARPGREEQLGSKAKPELARRGRKEILVRLAQLVIEELPDLLVLLVRLGYKALWGHKAKQGGDRLVRKARA